MNKTNIWVNAEDLNRDETFLKASSEEFASITEQALTDADGVANMQTNRRDFLKYLGFGLGAATLAACEQPVRKSVAYATRPEELVPGVANYYASSFVNGSDYCAILVKTREGRPIKIEGNTLSKVTKGGTSARAQASVLSLYDTARVRAGGKVQNNRVTEMDWADLDAQIKSKLASAGSIAILTHNQMSPTLNAALAEFVAKYPAAKVVSYDSVSYSGLLDANSANFGVRVAPSYHFDKAKLVVSIECDFLGTWLSPVEFAHDYAKNRKAQKMKDVKSEMSRHIQFESRMSLTGSNADNRVLVKPSEQGLALATLFNEIAVAKGEATITVPGGNFAWPKASAAVKRTAQELLAHQGNSLLVCGINDKAMQVLVNKINSMLGNYGSTIDFNHHSNQAQGSDQAIVDFSNNGADAVIVLGCNPAYDVPMVAQKVADQIKKAKLSVSMNAMVDETSALCQYMAPDHHALESWGDVEPKNGHVSIIQPTISSLFKTRQAGQSFLTWAESTNLDAKAEQPYYEYLKKNWETNFFPKQTEFASFQAFWDNSVHDGVFEYSGAPVAVAGATFDTASAAAALGKPSGQGIEVSFYETVNIGNGAYANNPWLQEMPDPVMRTTWDNILSVPVKWDGDNNYIGFQNLADGDKVNVTIGGKEYSLTVVRQFGQMENTVSIGLGYGRTMAGACGTGVGANIYPSVTFVNGTFRYNAVGVNVSGSNGKDGLFACVQMHHTYGLKNTDKASGKTINVDEQVLGHRGFQGSLTDRSVLYTATASDIDESKSHLAEKRAKAGYLNSKGLYPELRESFYGRSHLWGLSIDLSSCIGCGACTVACMAENNVPVVGKREVMRVHEMTWLRIDRYFYGKEETPNTAYMPMMCQHCNSAPCENVCPVNATNHSHEGLNQMTYNRCIGTRYCANNCPYKVRRFNWLDYTSADMFAMNEVNLNKGREGAEEVMYMTDNLTRMVLNPDVTVRSRGVIEKCSFCVQRIQEGKLTAKTEGRKLVDGDVKSACQTACPTGAIVFGDQNDEQSKITELFHTDLTYFALEEVNIRPNVGYLMKVNNRKEDFDA